MGLTASNNDSGGFTQAPEGTHRAVCYKIVDAGTREESYESEPPKKRHVIFIFWELPDELNDDGKPLSILKQYTLSLNENSNLHKDLKSWRGKSFTADELKGFDLKNILGISCDLEIVHNKNDKAKVASIFKPDGGAKKCATQNEQVAFDLDDYCNEFNGNSCDASKAACDIWDTLPEFIHEMVTDSFEMKAAEAKGRTIPDQASVNVKSSGLAQMGSKKKAEDKAPEFEDDDIPF